MDLVDIYGRTPVLHYPASGLKRCISADHRLWPSVARSIVEPWADAAAKIGMLDAMQDPVWLEKMFGT